MDYKFVIIFLISSLIKAASCCGGGGGASSFIFDDSKMQFKTSYSNSLYTDDVNSAGIKKDRNIVEIKELIEISTTKKINDYFQGALSLSGAQITKDSNSSSSSSFSAGDLKIATSYEFIQRFYSQYRPRVLMFLGGNIPLGNSKYDFKEITATDAASSGLYSLDYGIILQKTMRLYSIQASVYGRQFFDRDFGAKKISKDQQILSSLNASIPLSSTDFSMLIGYSYENGGKEQTTGAVASKSAAVTQSILNGGIFYQISEEASASINYSTNIIDGLNKNTSIAKIIALSAVYSVF